MAGSYLIAVKKTKAVGEKKEPAVSNQGVIYYFSSVENKEKFKKNPTRYETEPGGCCAYTMGAKGGKAKLKPAGDARWKNFIINQ